MKPDKIVINTLSLLSKLTGIGKYTFEICKRITKWIFMLKSIIFTDITVKNYT